MNFVILAPQPIHILTYLTIFVLPSLTGERRYRNHKRDGKPLIIYIFVSLVLSVRYCGVVTEGDIKLRVLSLGLTHSFACCVLKPHVPSHSKPSPHSLPLSLLSLGLGQVCLTFLYCSQAWHERLEGRNRAAAHTPCCPLQKNKPSLLTLLCYSHYALEGKTRQDRKN